MNAYKKIIEVINKLRTRKVKKAIGENSIKIKEEKMNIKNYTSKEIPILKEQLETLLDKNNNTDGIVISLQGHWGIGKTFFWDDFSRHTWGENERVYISLFGKHTLDDIKKQIVLKVYDRNKMANFMENNPVIGKIMESKWGIDATMVANSFTKDTFKGIVLCFDDFERISPNLSITEILGYIAELKEQNKCKIILINNNDSLKEQDFLNHKKVLKKITIEKDEETIQKEELKYGNTLEEYKIKEKVLITQTNNQEIFDKFSEKIIDYRLYYEPHYSDNLALVLDDELKFVNWKLVEELLSQVADSNKQCNIRLMKQFVSKLKLFEDSMNSTINKRISNSIVYITFKQIFKQTKIHTNKFEFVNIDTLVTFLDVAVKKHYLDKETFGMILQSLNNEINKNNIKNEIYDTTNSIYNKYLYDLEYEDFTFANDFYKLFNEHEQSIVSIVSPASFQLYIDLMIKVDTLNTNDYQELYTKAMKHYIDTTLQNFENTPEFLIEDRLRILEDNPELKSYLEGQKKALTTLKITERDFILKTIQDMQEKKGWGKEQEELLNSIDIQQHKEWMKQSPEYLEECFDFLRWISGFSGDMPFKYAYQFIYEAITELSREKKYQNKLSLMLDNITPKKY